MELVWDKKIAASRHLHINEHILKIMDSMKELRTEPGGDLF